MANLLRILKLSSVLIICVASFADGVKYVTEFNCNTSGGKFLISSSSWSAASSALASQRCSGPAISFTLITDNDIDMCFHAYRTHMEQLLGRTVTAYTAGGCYPSASACNDKSAVICKGSDSAAAPGNPACSETLSLTNGRVLYPSGTVYPASAYYLCNPGYGGSGSAKSQCQKDSMTWKPPTSPTCIAYTCQFKISNALIGPTGPVYNITCSAGYYLDGPSMVTCNGNNQHTTLPTCNKIPNCTLTVQHGSIYGIAPHYTVECDLGYQINGTKTVNCVSNISHVPFPTCAPNICSAPVLANGILTERAPAFKVVCFDGFLRIGQETVFCLSNTKTTPLPNCTAYSGTCDRSTLENGYTQPNDNSMVRRLSCKSGYRLYTSPHYTCVSSSISKRITTCKKIVCNSSSTTINNGFLQPPDGIANERATVICSAGYSLAGSLNATCGADGMWNTTAVCKGDPCHELTIPNSNVSGLKASTGEVFYVGCKEGFNLQGNPTIFCVSPSYWKSLPHCEPVRCKGTPIVQSGSVLVGHITPTFGTMAIIICNSTYELHGNRTITCSANGTWTNNGQTCKESTPTSDTTTTCKSSNSTVYVAIIGVLGVVLVVLLITVIYLVMRTRTTGLVTIMDNSGASRGVQCGAEAPSKANRSVASLRGDQYGTIGDSCSAETSNDGDQQGDTGTGPEVYSDIADVVVRTPAAKEAPKPVTKQPDPPMTDDTDVYSCVDDPKPRPTSEGQPKGDFDQYAYAAVDASRLDKQKAAPKPSHLVQDDDRVPFTEPRTPTADPYTSFPQSDDEQADEGMYAMVDIKKKKRKAAN
eukprot:scpid42643/ scgid2125/ Sushi, von Willebrand factor type A, EGF and pentraxin domain-containing protein 1